jgi:S1-C subfamily serine protease
MRKIINLTLLFFLIGTLAQQAESQTKKRSIKTDEPKNLTAEQIAKKYLPSVVLIVCDDGAGSYSQGSGFFVKEGVILTNHHVIEGMKRGKAKIALDSNIAKEWWIEKVLYTDEKNDLALLSVTETDKVKTPFLNLSETGKVNIGETIYVLSNPKGLAGTISQGIVSSEIRKTKDTELLQIDAPISSGSSGGAVLNAHGEVVGIATASLSSGQNLNFAVPSFQIKSFLGRYDINYANKNYSYYQDEAINNSWKEVRIEQPSIGEGSASSFSKTQRESKLTYEQITKDIIKTLKTPLKDIAKMQVSDISFLQCSFNLKVSYNKAESINHIYQTKITFIKDIKFKTDNNGIEIVFNKKFLASYTIDKHRIYALTDTLFIPVENQKEAISVLANFKLLKNICAGEQNSTQLDKPTLKETTDWLTNKIEGTEYIPKSGWFIKYERLRFSGCQMSFSTINRGSVYSIKNGWSVERVDLTHTFDLRLLLNIDIDETWDRETRDKDGGRTSLTFNKKFDVIDENIPLPNSFPSGPYHQINQLPIYTNNFEDSEAISVAFARLLEICIEE